MVSASMYAKFLKEQEIKEKRRLEKEGVEKKIKEEIYRLAKERKLERELAEALEEKLEEKLYRLERSRRERESRRQLRLKKKTEILEHIPKHIGITKTTEFIFTEEEKEKCRNKTLDQLTDEISGSKLVCPPGKELKKEISPRELTADLICFRKRVRKKSPEEIVAMYDKLLETDPERLCKKIEKREKKDNK